MLKHGLYTHCLSNCCCCSYEMINFVFKFCDNQLTVQSTSSCRSQLTVRLSISALLNCYWSSDCFLPSHWLSKKIQEFSETRRTHVDLSASKHFIIQAQSTHTLRLATLKILIAYLIQIMPFSSFDAIFFSFQNHLFIKKYSNISKSCQLVSQTHV